MATAIIPEGNQYQHYVSYIAVSLGVTRIIYRCKNKQCKHTWAYEYRRAYTFLGGWMGNERLGRYEPARFILYRVSDGSRESTDHRTCPLCGKQGTGNIVKGTFSPKPCDARCLGAKGPICDCSCAGGNHGKNYCG